MHCNKICITIKYLFFRKYVCIYGDLIVITRIIKSLKLLCLFIFALKCVLIKVHIMTFVIKLQNIHN